MNHNSNGKKPVPASRLAAGIIDPATNSPLPQDRPPPGAPGWRLYYSADEAREIDQGGALWRALLAAAGHVQVREALAGFVREVVRQDIAEAFGKRGNHE